MQPLLNQLESVAAERVLQENLGEVAVSLESLLEAKGERCRA